MAAGAAAHGSAVVHLFSIAVSLSLARSQRQPCARLARSQVVPSLAGTLLLLRALALRSHLQQRFSRGSLRTKGASQRAQLAAVWHKRGA